LLLLYHLHSVSGGHCHLEISSGCGWLGGKKGESARFEEASADSMPSGPKKSRPLCHKGAPEVTWEIRAPNRRKVAIMRTGPVRINSRARSLRAKLRI